MRDVAAATLLLCDLRLSAARRRQTRPETRRPRSRTCKAEHPRSAPSQKRSPADAILAPLAQAAIAPRISAPIRAGVCAARRTRAQGTTAWSRLKIATCRAARSIQQGRRDAGAGRLYDRDTGHDPGRRAEGRSSTSPGQGESRGGQPHRRRTQAAARARAPSRGRDADTAIAAAVQAQATYDTAVKHLAKRAEHHRSKPARKRRRAQLTSAQGKPDERRGAGGLCEPAQPHRRRRDGPSAVPGRNRRSGSAGHHGDGYEFPARQAAHRAVRRAEAEARRPRPNSRSPAKTSRSRPRSSLISPALDPGSTTVEVWLKLPNPEGR